MGLPEVRNGAFICRFSAICCYVGMKMNISAIKMKLFPARRKNGNTMPIKDMGILDHLDRIVEVSREHGIDKCLSRAKIHLDYVGEKLGISHLQAVLFSHFMERSMDNCIEIGEIAEATKCSKLRIIKYANDCEELEKKKLIRCRRNKDSMYFRVPRNVIDSIRWHNEFRPEKNENLTIEEFFTLMERLFEERENGELTYEAVGIEMTDIVNQNKQLLFCKKILSYKFYNDDFLLLLCFCHLCANNNDENIGAHDIEFLYDNKSRFRRLRESLSDGSHNLIVSKFVEHTNANGFVNPESWKVSDMAKKDLLSELNLVSRNYKKDLILHDNIKVKKMFYNSRETGEIQKLASLLQEEHYLKIQERLEGKGMRKGFACLFSGGPGTGKTETAYQIARQTKRNIMMVDIAQTKSMWYGESEKRIKEIFDSYRSAVDNSEIAPILLFNEADAVIGKRKEFSSGNGAIDKTENTIQNIILQEMETISGIMIATTNMAQNMDSAFERRFLYKITFDKPCVEGRKGIWQALLSGLPESDVDELSSRFELSGGQIENIARKIEVDAIIDGGDLSIDTLVQYCKDELQNSLDASKKVGFLS
jgi:AAA+ superfamily predicted ATPase